MFPQPLSGVCTGADSTQGSTPWPASVGRDARLVYLQFSTKALFRLASYYCGRLDGRVSQVSGADADRGVATISARQQRDAFPNGTFRHAYAGKRKAAGAPAG